MILIICLPFFISLLFIPLAHTEPMPISNKEIGAIVDAIYIIEGGAKAKKPFGILSVPCNSYATCRTICYNTVRNNFYRWSISERSIDYFSFLGNRYAPIEAENDLKNLNKNWEKNLRQVLDERNFPVQKLRAIR